MLYVVLPACPASITGRLRGRSSLHLSTGSTSLFAGTPSLTSSLGLPRAPPFGTDRTHFQGTLRDHGLRSTFRRGRRRCGYCNSSESAIESAAVIVLTQPRTWQGSLWASVLFVHTLHTSLPEPVHAWAGGGHADKRSSYEVPLRGPNFRVLSSKSSGMVYELWESTESIICLTTSPVQGARAGVAGSPGLGPGSQPGSEQASDNSP